jgi:hypothetical protein
MAGIAIMRVLFELPILKPKNSPLLQRSYQTKEMHCGILLTQLIRAACLFLSLSIASPPILR